MKIFDPQIDDSSHFWSRYLVPLFGPTFCGDLIKIGRESKWEEKSIPTGNQSNYLLIRKQALHALGRCGFMFYGCKITLFKHQIDEKEGPKSGTHFGTHFLVPLFGPTFCGDLVKIGRETKVYPPGIDPTISCPGG